MTGYGTAEHNKRQVELRLARLAAGLCASCGKRNPIAGRAMCIPCRDRDRRSGKERRKKLRILGLCAQCGQHDAPAGKGCGGCIARRARQRRLARVVKEFEVPR